MTNWQPIDSAPKDQTIIGYRSAVDAMWFIYWGPAGWRIVGTNSGVTPTHWMPLPTPPEGENPQ